MVTPVLSRVPPPPKWAVDDPTFNKWLIDLTQIINSGGGSIDPSLIPGYDALVATVNLHSTQIASNTVNIAANTSAIATINSVIASLQIAVNSLLVRSQVRNGIVAPGAGLGNNGDWYADTVAKHIYVKVTGAWVLIV